MTIDELIQKQERGLEILEAIKGLDRRRQLKCDSANGFAGTFPKLRKKYINDIDTIERGMKRLMIKFKALQIN